MYMNPLTTQMYNPTTRPLEALAYISLWEMKSVPSLQQHEIQIYKN